MANLLNPQLDQEPSQGLQKRIPEDPEQAAFFDLDDIVPTPLVPQYTPFVKKAGVYPEPYRTELPLTVTNVFDLKVLAREKFTLTSTGNRARFNTLDMVLRTNGLASMVDRDRTIPLPTANNPFGIIPPHCTTINGEYVVLSADSIAKYQHGLIMNTAFDKTLHHHSIGYKTTKTQKPRPILVYEDMKRYFYGQDNQGIQAARDALTNYKTNPSCRLNLNSKLSTIEYPLAPSH